MNLDDLPSDAEFEEMERRLRQLKENFDIDAQENNLDTETVIDPVTGSIRVWYRGVSREDLWAERKLDEIVRRR